jgi:hypothetical protein
VEDQRTVDVGVLGDIGIDRRKMAPWAARLEMHVLRLPAPGRLTRNLCPVIGLEAAAVAIGQAQLAQSGAMGPKHTATIALGT